MERPEVAKDGSTVIVMPTWVLVVRILQFILSIIILGCAAWFIHGLYLNALGFAIACSIFTWVIFFYAVLSERVSGCHPAYNTWAILSLDGFMIILWLTSMAYVAWTRSEFKYNVEATCTSDGSTVNSGHCTVYGRSMLDKRDDVAGVASLGALGVVSGIAGISAIEMLLFVASFAYLCHMFRISFPASTADPEKPTPQPIPMVQPVEPQQPQMFAQQPQQMPQQQMQQPGWVDPAFAQQQQPGGVPIMGQPQVPQQQMFVPQQQMNGGGIFSPDQIGQQQVPLQQQQQQPVMYAPQGTPSPVYPQQQQGAWAAPQPVSPIQQFPPQQQMQAPYNGQQVHQ